MNKTNERLAGSAMAERAARIGPILRAETNAIETAGSLTKDAVDALRDAGLLRMWVPTAYGGPQTSAAEAVDALIELGRHDGPASWSAMIANTTALLSARLDPAIAGKLFGEPSAMAAGVARPTGQAAMVAGGGMRVTGRWQWGSFSRHATVVGGGSVVTDRVDGAPLAPFVFFDPADIEWIDNWQVVGLRGTGSSDWRVSDAFVPEGHWADMASGAPPVIDAPLYRFSFFGLLAAGVAASAIGIADAALEAFVTIASDRGGDVSAKAPADRPAVQATVARAEATIASATAFLHDAIGSAWGAAEAGDAMTDDHKRMLRLAATDATQRCADAVGRLYRTAGGEAVYERCPLEKLWRDSNVAAQHGMVSDRLFETVGRLRVGVETSTRLL